MKEITQLIAQALVDRPDEVSVTGIDSDHTSILRVSVGVGDTGKIIGKQGRTANALRTILNAIASKERKRVILEIADELNNRSKPVSVVTNLPPRLQSRRDLKIEKPIKQYGMPISR